MNVILGVQPDAPIETNAMGGKQSATPYAFHMLPPNAVFAAADSLASGALQFLYQAGARVPQDVSFMGYDNTLATLLAPPLDSVGIQAGPMGEAAVDLLLRRRQHPLEPGQPGEEILVPTRLVSRGTVAPPSRLSLEKRKTPRS